LAAHPVIAVAAVSVNVTVAARATSGTWNDDRCGGGVAAAAIPPHWGAGG
jgi:hypothetical protein